MIKEQVKDEGNELRDYVDDMVIFKEGDTEEQTMEGLYQDLMAAKHKLSTVRQVMNDGGLLPNKEGKTDLER